MGTAEQIGIGISATSCASKRRRAHTETGAAATGDSRITPRYPGANGRRPAYFAVPDLDPKVGQLSAIVVVPIRWALAIAQHTGTALEERPKPNLERVEQRHPALELGCQKLKARCAFRARAVDRTGEA